MSLEVGHFVSPGDWVEDTMAFFQSVDTTHLIFAELDVANVHVFGQSLDS